MSKNKNENILQLNGKSGEMIDVTEYEKIILTDCSQIALIGEFDSKKSIELDSCNIITFKSEIYTRNIKIKNCSHITFESTVQTECGIEVPSSDTETINFENDVNIQSH